MTTQSFNLLLLLLLHLLPQTTALASRATSCRHAHTECTLKLAGYPPNTLPHIPLPPHPDTSFTPHIVSKHPWERLGTLRLSPAADVIVSGNRALPLTRYGTPHFAKGAFYAREVQRVVRWQGSVEGVAVISGNGVAHRAFRGTQLREGSDFCIRLFVSSYQLLDKKTGFVRKNVQNVPRKKNKCVVFMTVPWHGEPGDDGDTRRR